MPSYSFDIVSKVDKQELVNALNQTTKDIKTRYDFKGSKSDIELNQKENFINILADDDLKLRSIVDILKSKMVKRKIPLKAMHYNKAEEASGGMLKQRVDIQSGITKEKAKEIVKYLKGTKLKHQSQIQEDMVRISGKNKDELQDIISKLKEEDFGIHISFENYR